ncbi:MAG: ribose-5-phosphate isomerase RpiA [bacterium]
MSGQKAKQAAAERAVSHIANDMIVGLGTGSTASCAIEAIGRRVAAGLRILSIPTSSATEKLAIEKGIPLASDFERLDVTIDGADEADENGNLIKGGGGALAREKIVAAATRKEIIVVDKSKLVSKLGKFPLPVEVLPFGWPVACKQLQHYGCRVELRRRDGIIFVTDNKNYILDCFFGLIDEPGKLSEEINAIPGVVENGLFVGLTDMIVVGYEDGHVEEMTFEPKAHNPS